MRKLMDVETKALEDLTSGEEATFDGIMSREAAAESPIQPANESNPKPLGGSPKDLAPAGKEIFEEGISDANIPPCASCHGPEAKGNGAFPRLAGQVYPYIIKVLTNWDKERGQDAANPDTSAIMQPIAHNLNKSQIEFVAAYLSDLQSLRTSWVRLTQAN